jgi:DNA-binding LacI/PurR family transcriptional regulator
MTVSRALREGTPVSEKTRSSVRKIARQLGYRPNPVGAALRSGRSLEVGVTYEALIRADFSSILAELNTKLTRKGYYMRMLEPHPDKLEVAHVREFDGTRLQGLILANAAKRNVVSWLNHIETHAVWLMEHPDSPPGTVHFFGSDDTQATFELLEHLRSLGHRRIAHLYGEPATFGAGQRREAYVKFMASHQLEAILESTNYEPEGGYESIQRLIKRHPEVTAVFCSNDNTAVGAMFKLRELGYRIPQDISIIGFGSPSQRHYEFFYPGLTTARHRYREIGLLAVDCLVALMAGEDIAPQDHLLPAEAIIRSTTAAPAR